MTFCCENPYQTICKNKDLSVLKSLIDLAGAARQGGNTLAWFAGCAVNRFWQRDW
jgi:hypothetical protein